MASADQKLIVKKKRGDKDPALMVTDTGPAAASLDFVTWTHAYCIGHWPSKLKLKLKSGMPATLINRFLHNIYL